RSTSRTQTQRSGSSPRRRATEPKPEVEFTMSAQAHAYTSFKTFPDPAEAHPTEAVEACYMWEDLRDEKLTESGGKPTPFVVFCEVMRLHQRRWAQAREAGRTGDELPKPLDGDNFLSTLFAACGNRMHEPSAKRVAMMHVQAMYDVAPEGGWGEL